MYPTVTDWGKYDGVDINDVEDLDVFAQLLLKRKLFGLLPNSLAKPDKQGCIISALKNKELRDSFFKDMEKGTILELLTNPLTRDFSIPYLERIADSSQVLTDTVYEMYTHHSIYPWILTTPRIVFLLPKAVIKTIMTAYIPQIEMKTTVDIYSLSLDEKYHFSKSTFEGSSQMFPFSGNQKRKDYFALLKEVFSEIHSFIKTVNEKVHIKAMDIVQSHFSRLQGMKTFNKELKGTIGSLYIDCMTKNEVVAWFLNQSFADFNTADSFKAFVSIITKNIQSRNQRKVELLVNSLFGGNTPKSYFFSLKALSIDEPSTDKGKIWPCIIKKAGEIASRELISNMYSPLFSHVLQSMFIEKNDQITPGEIYLTYDESMMIVNKVIDEVLKTKNTLKIDDHPRYSKLVCSLIIYLITATDEQFPGDSIFDRVYMNAIKTRHSPFEYLSTERRDFLLMEAIKHPQQNELFAPWITKRLINVLLGMFLKFSSVSVMRMLLPDKRRNVADEYGFMKEKITYPPLYSDNAGKPITVEESMSLFEIFLQKAKWMESKNIAFFQSGFNTYRLFLEKMLLEAYQKNDLKLKEHSINVFKRLCRLLLSSTRQLNTKYQLCTVVAVVTTPLALSIGFSLDQNFAHFVFENFVRNIPIDSTYISFPHCTIISQLLSSSYSKYLPNLDDVSSALIKLDLDFMGIEAKNRTIPQIAITASFCPELNEADYITFAINYMNERGKLIPFKQSRILENKTVLKELIYPSFSSTLIKEKMIVVDAIKMKTGGKTYLRVVQYINDSIEKLNTEPAIQNKDQKKKKGISQFGKMLIQALIQIQMFSINEEIYQERNEVYPSYQFTINLTQASSEFLKNFIGENSNIFPILKSPLLSAIPNVLNYGKQDQNQKKGKQKPKFVQFEYTLTVNENLINARENEEKVWKDLISEQNQLISSIKENDKERKNLLKKLNVLQTFSFPEPFKHPVYKINEIAKDKQPKQKEIPVKYDKLSYPLNERVVSSLLSSNADEFISFMTPLGKEMESAVEILEAFSQGVNFNTKNPKLISHFLYLLLNEMTKPLYTVKDNQNYSYRSHANSLISRISQILPYKGLTRSLSSDVFLPSLKKLSLLSEKEVFQNMASADFSCLDYFADIMNKIFYHHPDNILFEVFDSFLFSKKILLKNAYKESKKTKFLVYIQKLVNYLTTGKKMGTDVITQILKVIMDPLICGFPLPQSSLDFLSILAQQKRPVEIKYAIIASVVSYIQYQFLIHVDPTQIEHLLNTFTLINKQDPSTLSVFLIMILNNHEARNAMANIPYFKEVLEENVNPCSYANEYFSSILSLPIEGKFEPVYEEIISNFVFSSLKSREQHLVELTGNILQFLSLGKGDLATKIAPFISQGISEFDPSEKGTSIIKYGISFITNAANQKFEAVLSSFNTLFDTLTKKINSASSLFLKSYLNKTNDYNSIFNIELIYQDINNSILMEVVQHINKKEWQDCSATSICCKALLTFIEKQDLHIHVGKFDELKLLVDLISSNHFHSFFECTSKTEAKGMSILLQLIEEKFRSFEKYQQLFRLMFELSKDSFTFEHVLMICQWKPEIIRIPGIASLLQESAMKSIPKDLPENELADLSLKISDFLFSSLPKPGIAHNSIIDENVQFSALSNCIMDSNQRTQRKSELFDARCQRIIHCKNQIPDKRFEAYKQQICSQSKEKSRKRCSNNIYVEQEQMIDNDDSIDYYSVDEGNEYQQEFPEIEEEFSEGIKYSDEEKIETQCVDDDVQDTSIYNFFNEV